MQTDERPSTNLAFFGKSGTLPRGRFAIYLLTQYAAMALLRFLGESHFGEYSESRRLYFGILLVIFLPPLFGLIARRTRDAYGDERKGLTWVFFIGGIIFILPFIYLMFVPSRTSAAASDAKQQS